MLPLYPIWLTCSLAVALSACTDAAPPCPPQLISHPAASAGCLVVNDQRLLVIEGLNSKISIPGGSGNKGEPAHCTAHRETWEETGFNVEPTQLIRVFDNGFHLYDCQWHGEPQTQTPPFYLEIKRAFWINAAQFDEVEWRFPAQAQWLKAQLQKRSPTKPQSPSAPPT